ncbi:MAG: glycosyltransferase [Propionibacteriaceae bacterium]
MPASRPGTTESLVVQQSFPEPRPTTNPYIVMLRASIESTPGLELRTFSWRAALLGRYDVFHAHWPEILVAGRTAPRALARQLLTLALLLRLRLTRTPIVRTLHNLKRPEGISRRENAILALFERQTTLLILLNSSTPPPAGKATATVLHGHYRDWFARYPQPDPVPGRLSYFGLIRRYKGVDVLLRAFRELTGDVSLRVAGKPSSGELAQSLTALAADDPRVRLDLAFVPDEELARVACEGELVVLPYREMHNSGGALTALSLNRPVLVPANEVNDQLSAEVGPGWVHSYAGELSADQLRSTLEAVHTTDRTDRPDLSRREWDLAGRQHLEAYRQAIGIVRGR